MELAILILAGGEGTRLAPLTNDTPKILVPFMDNIFLSKIWSYLDTYFTEYHKIPTFISTGFKADKLKKLEKSYGFTCIEEDLPLGTGGAIYNAMKKIDCETLLVMNGDLLTNIPLDEIWHSHFGSKKWCTIASVTSNNLSRFGVLSSSRKSFSYTEKPQETPRYTGDINAGIYCINCKEYKKRAEERFRSCTGDTTNPTNFSIERQIFSYANDINVYHAQDYNDDIHLTDIGTLESYRDTQLRLNNGQSLIDKSVKVGNNTIITNSIIHKKCVIESNCVIDRCILTEGCIVKAGSVLKDNCLGKGSAIESKII